MLEDEVTALMSDPATHGGAAVEVVRTHGARVFLAGPLAWKVKRPVRYDYMDFTAAGTRRAMLARELDLNRPAAPQIYDRLVAITRQPDGRLALGGDGPAVDWALRMNRFPAGAELDRIAARGGIDGALAAALGASVAALHADAPRRGGDGAARVAAVVDGVGGTLARLAPVLGSDAARFAPTARAALARVAGLLQRRAAAGWVRRCHGDLHLGNLVLIDGRPVPFDALEFDEALGTLDVLYDLAFLLMDLRQAGCAAAANTVLNRWLHQMDDPVHLDALAALPLFLALRAAIRAMVAAQRAQAPQDPAVAEARRYLAAALGYLMPGPARLVAVGGLSGSGKSTLAAALAPDIGPAPGAVLLRSDLIRKTQAGVAETARLAPDSYTRAASAAVYATMRARAARALAAGHGVVLDGVHLDPAERSAAAALAGRLRFDGLWLQAPECRLMARVAARQGDASDADAGVVRAQLATAPAVADWPALDGSQAPEDVLAAARARLGLAQG